MDKISNYLKKADKPSFGSDREFNYAVNVKGLESNGFYTKSFGHQISDLRKIQEFQNAAKKGYVDAKGKATLTSVKNWVKENHPQEFYARWKKDSSHYKDDSVEIHYK